MTSSELRSSAREALKGKWGKAALITLVYTIITFVISFVLTFIPFVGNLASFVISLPLSYGILVSFIKLKRNEEVGYADFLNSGFSAFGKVWAVFGNMILKLIVPVVLVIIFILLLTFSGVGAGIGAAFSSANATVGFAGLAIVALIGYIASLIYLIVKSYYYSLSYYILYDNQDKTGKEIVEESERLMTGNRWSFFWLGLTFIGWVILSAFTLYIGMLWLMPYIMVTFVCFYESLAGTKGNIEAEATTEVNPIKEEGNE